MKRLAIILAFGVLYGCSIVNRPCTTLCLPHQRCLAGICVDIEKPPAVECPATCPAGQSCTDPTLGCMDDPFVPVDPEPICQPNQNCGCYHRPPGEDWSKLECSVGQVCENFVCKPKPIDPDPEPTPEPPPVGSAGAFPQGLPDSAFTAIEDRSTLHDEVNRVMSDLTGCAVGVTCLTNDTPVGFMWRVNSKLRERGRAAGRHDDNNSERSSGTDEITARKSDPSDPACIWEGFHVVFYGVPNTVVWAMKRDTPCHGHSCSGGGAYRGNFQIPDSYCNTEQPIPPGPQAEPPADFGCPPTGAVGLPQYPLRVWTKETLPPGWGDNEIGQPAWSLLSSRHNDLIDTTAVVFRQEPYCRAIGMSPYADGQPRASCPMRPEGNQYRVACERYIAEGDWILDSRNGTSCVASEDNSAQFYPNNGNCRLCNPKKTVCTDWY